MKLTEQQLAEIFKNSTKNKQSTVSAEDCLGAVPASATRLNKSEDIINDFDSAQGMKLAFAFKPWSEAVTETVKANQKPRFNLFGLKNPFKAAIATMAFAFAFVVALPEFNQTETIMLPAQNDYANDVIQVAPFEGYNNTDDILSSGGFDKGGKDQDDLFGASFG